MAGPERASSATSSEDRAASPGPDGRAADGRTIVITYGWCLGTPGGVARHVQELARALAKRGVRVVIVCVKAAGYTSFPRPTLDPRYLGTEVEAELARHGVEVVRVEPHPLHWMLDGRPVRRAVARLADARRIDAVLGFYNEAAGLPDLCALRGIRFGFIATWLSYRMALAPERQGSGLRRLWRLRGNRRFIVEPYQRAEVVFANSEFTRGELIDVVGVRPERIVVTYLGISPFFFDVPREPESSAAPIERFVFFGRIVREKGIVDALRALAKAFAGRGSAWSLRVIGSGHHEHVRRVAGELGIAEHVTVLDHQGDEALARDLERAQVAILPSHSESFGLAIAEAQAAGLPVIAYAAGSVPEVVGDGPGDVTGGWLAPLHDVDALARLVTEAVDDPERTFAAGLAARERVRERFRWDRTAERLLAGLPQRARPGRSRR